MTVVTLMSGGLDSSVVAKLLQEEGTRQLPLFIDYGQLARDQELSACRSVVGALSLPEPAIASVPGVGSLLSSGLTNRSLHVANDAFLPGRNILFLTLASAYAVQHGADSVAIGLLDDAYSLFPDQTRSFLRGAEGFLSAGLGQPIRVLAPLMTLTKSQVVQIARAWNISGTYSCHTGRDVPCGKCIACQEYDGLEA